MNRRMSAVLLIAIAGALLLSLVTEIDNYLSSPIEKERFNKLQVLGQYIRDRRWTEPIIVSWGDPGVWFWSLDRTYLGGEVGQVYNYYGKLQELYHLAPPLNESSYRILPNQEFVAASRHAVELRERFGNRAAEVRDHPVVFLVPDTYNRPISESFRSLVEIAPGVWAIPPGSVTEAEVNLWTLLAASDYTWSTGGYEDVANWSAAPRIFRAFEAALNTTFIVRYRFGNTIGSAYDLSFHLMDYASEYRPGVPYPPLEFWVDGTLLFTRGYAGTGPAWVGVRTGLLDPRIHTLEIRAGVRGMPFILGLDFIRAEPAPARTGATGATAGSGYENGKGTQAHAAVDLGTNGLTSRPRLLTASERPHISAERPVARSLSRTGRAVASEDSTPREP